MEYIIIEDGKYIFSTFNESEAKKYLKKNECAYIVISERK